MVYTMHHGWPRRWRRLQMEVANRRVLAALAQDKKVVIFVCMAGVSDSGHRDEDTATKKSKHTGIAPVGLATHFIRSWVAWLIPGIPAPAPLMVPTPGAALPPPTGAKRGQRRRACFASPGPPPPAIIRPLPLALTRYMPRPWTPGDCSVAYGQGICLGPHATGSRY
jgi:hypothetical protein